MYHPFPTREACEQALETLHYAMADVWRAEGFTVIPPYYIVGKIEATKEDNSDPAALTTKWCDPVELADGRWGIPSFRAAFPTLHVQLEQLLPSLEDVAALVVENEDA